MLITLRGKRWGGKTFGGEVGGVPGRGFAGYRQEQRGNIKDLIPRWDEKGLDKRSWRGATP